MKILSAFLINLKTINIEVDEYVNDDFYIVIKDQKCNFKKIINGNIINCLLDENINLHLNYQILYHDDKIRVDYSKFVNSKEFDELYSTNAKLGVSLSFNKTIFTIWSPTASLITLVLDNTKYPMTYNEKGVWEKSFDEDLEGSHYYYLVRQCGKTLKCLDPYGLCVTKNAEENVVIDLVKTNSIHHTIKNDKNVLIEEVSVRDATIKKGGGTFKALKEDDELIHYFEDMGFTHVQLMPTFTFGGIDDDDIGSYNWGYNPVAYFAVSNYLTSDKKDEYAAINEFKSLINRLHKHDIGVTLDVVFNHVYNQLTFPFEVLVPGYAFFKDGNKFTSSSGCGNDLNTNKLMVKRFIIDNLIYFVELFKIDGFRFDLMGLLSIDLMKEIETKLRKIRPDILLYGEGWNIPSMLGDGGTTLANAKLIPNYAFFNDRFRNILKPDISNSNYGFLFGNIFHKNDMYNILLGSMINNPNFNSFNQSINYIECHDDYTFYDAFHKICPNKSNDDYQRFLILGLAFITFSFGIPFYHQGMEFGRNKKGVKNSYNAGDFINGVEYSQMTNYENVINALQKFIKIRKDLEIYEENNIKIVTSKVQLADDLHSFGVNVLDNDEYLMIFKNDYIDENITFDKEVLSIFNGLTFEKKHIKHLKLNKPGFYLIKK